MDKISDSDFMDIWIKSFEFAMMNNIIVNKYLGSDLVYIKDCRINFTGKAKKVSQDEVINFISELGISSTETQKAFEKIKKDGKS